MNEGWNVKRSLSRISFTFTLGLFVGWMSWAHSEFLFGFDEPWLAFEKYAVVVSLFGFASIALLSLDWIFCAFGFLVGQVIYITAYNLPVRLEIDIVIIPYQVQVVLWLLPSVLAGILCRALWEYLVQ